ncbi:MAG: GxxExxY protein [Deltaproteobacteria bacterium]|nr:GxxExxY protein [Deltaproteobacteria bacterium]
MYADFQDYKNTELIQKIINVFYKAYNKPGYGFTEKVYDNALML